jgi:hypothetical protein
MPDTPLTRLKLFKAAAENITHPGAVSADVSDDDNYDHSDFKNRRGFKFNVEGALDPTDTNASRRRQISTNECPYTELIIIKSVLEHLSAIFNKINLSSTKDVYIEYVNGKDLNKSNITFENLNTKLSELISSISDADVIVLIDGLTTLLIDIYKYTRPIIEDDYIRQNANYQDRSKQFSNAAVGFKALTDFSLAFVTILPSLTSSIFPELPIERSNMFSEKLTQLYSGYSEGGKPKKHRSTIRKTRRNKNKSRRS